MVRGDVLRKSMTPKMSGKFAMIIRAKAVPFAAVTGNAVLYPEDDVVKISFGLDPDLKFILDWDTKTL
jgi:hypothetical protein